MTYAIAKVIYHSAFKLELMFVLNSNNSVFTPATARHTIKTICMVAERVRALLFFGEMKEPKNDFLLDTQNFFLTITMLSSEKRKIFTLREK
jgi:hypothetical protein